MYKVLDLLGSLNTTEYVLLVELAVGGYFTNVPADLLMPR